MMFLGMTIPWCLTCNILVAVLAVAVIYALYMKSCCSCKCSGGNGCKPGM